MELAILAGGFGTRLGNLTKNLPKPLIKIGNISFLEHLILNYSKYNLTKIYILCGFKGQLIKKKFHNKYFNGIKIICLIEKKPLGTGGALSLLKKKIKDNFFLINGDTFVDINLNKYSKVKLNNKVGIIFLTKKNLNLNKTLSVDKKKIIKFNSSSKYISAGLYFFNKKILKSIKSKYISLENEILKKYITQKKIIGYRHKGYFIDIGTPKDLKKIKKDFSKKKDCLLIDRDGVINKDKGYTFKTSELELNQNIIQLLKKIKKKFIFILTNQSGIARGFYREHQMHNFHLNLKKRLSKSNIFINDIEFCPHHTEGVIKKYSFNCNCRKPKIGMFKKINKKWQIDKKKSIMIGDQLSDFKFAKKCNLKFLYYSDLLHKKF